MNLERAGRVFIGSMTVGTLSLTGYLITGRSGLKRLSSAAGCMSFLCAGYIMGRLDT